MKWQDAITIIALCVAVVFSAFGQSASEFSTLDAAGKVTLIGKTVPDPKDSKKTIRDPDAVIVRTPKYDQTFGTQSTQDREFSIKGLQASIANTEAEVAKMKAMLARLQAVK